MTDRWHPPNITPDEVSNFLEIKSGIPQTSRRHIARWLIPDPSPYKAVNTELMSQFELYYGEEIFGEYGDSITAVSFWRFIQHSIDEKHLVALVDFALWRRRYGSSLARDKARELANILNAAGAGWKVSDQSNRYRLTARLPEGVEEIVDSVVNQSQQASDLLRRSWAYAFRASPQPSAAYSLAVKAAESVAIPTIEPKNSKATLGTCIGLLKNPANGWKFALQDPSNQDPADQLRQAMQALWHSQTDRHAGPPDYKDATQEQAQAAVLLASTIVGWFDLKLVSK